MKRKPARRWITILGSGGVLLQITACLGPEPQLLLASSAVNALVANHVTTVYNLLLGGLGGAA